MSLPTSNANGQSSIRNFFRPKQPAYAPPPSTAASRSQQTSPVPPPPPPAPAAGTPNQPSPRSPSNIPNSSSDSTLPSSPPPPSALHPQASISAILPEHVPALRRITSLLLPVNYPDSFYARLADPKSSGAFSRVVLWQDAEAAAPKVIGGLVCRPEPSPFHESSPTPLGGTSIFQTTTPTPAPTTTTTTQIPNALYIQSLVLLSPYRGLGLAAALLDDAARRAAASAEFACDTVYAHVWTENADGLRWYLARGFAQADEVKGYYFKLQPDSAWVVRRDILGSTSSALGLRDGNAAASGPGTSVTAAAANLPLNPPPPPPTTTTTTPPVLAASATLSPPPLPPRSNGGSGTTTPTGKSFQNARPETEWNDLPADMHVSRSMTTNGDGGANNNNNLGLPTGSGTSSRSSSTGRKKRDRAYPAAAFGS
ncbi:hypothetical protein F5X99DRAFT_427806 [Biscogniauxia marginata]|nr:hypothetical protein F5X99DRAFT_427806 [Biscogniauxia marginata]